MSISTNAEGKYKLLALSISTPNKPIDLSLYAVKCDIYESILSPSAIIEITISDSTGLLTAFNFVEECLCISYTTNNESTPVHYEFKILEVNPVRTLPSDKGVVFVMTGISEEILKAKTLKNIPLIRKKIESEKIVKAMLELTETKKELYFEKTKGLHTFSITNTTPFDAIDQVRKGAISEKYKGSAFVFFENKNGYHFKSIEKLVEEGLPNIGDKFFIHSTLAGSNVQGSKWRNIIAFKVIQNGNQNVGLAVGGYNNSIRRYNIETGELEFYEKNANQVDFLTMNEGSKSSSNEQQDKRNKDEGKIILSLYNGDQENNEYAEKQNLLPYYMTNFLSVIVHMTVYGDSSLTVGDMIACKIPEHTGLTLGDDRAYTDNDPITSGNYLVCKAHHVLTFGEFPQYYQGLEIIKDGIGGNSPKTRIV